MEILRVDSPLLLEGCSIEDDHVPSLGNRDEDRIPIGRHDALVGLVLGLELIDDAAGVPIELIDRMVGVTQRNHGVLLRPDSHPKGQRECCYNYERPDHVGTHPLRFKRADLSRAKRNVLSDGGSRSCCLRALSRVSLHRRRLTPLCEGATMPDTRPGARTSRAVTKLPPSDPYEAHHE